MLVHELRERLASLPDDAVVVVLGSRGDGIFFYTLAETAAVGFYSERAQAFREHVWGSVDGRGEARDTTRAIAIRSFGGAKERSIR